MKEEQVSSIDLLVPELAEDLEILPFSGGGFFVHHKENNRRININQDTSDLLTLVDGKRNIAEITTEFNERSSDQQVRKETVHHVLFEELAKYQIIKNDRFQVEINRSPDYLKLRVTLLKKDWIVPLLRIFSFLFNRRLFYILLGAAYVFIGITLLINFTAVKNAFLETSLLDWGVFVGITAFSLLLHEIGHASACYKLGARHGDIGFGFYLLRPVMYADVSDIWRLKKQDRMVVNLAGILMDMLLASIILLLFYFNQDEKYLLLTGILFLSTLVNLNPFLRHDGYWALVDATNTPNLRKLSNERLKTMFFNMLNGKGLNLTPVNLLLAIYALISSYMIVAVVFGVLFYDPYGIVNFPRDIAMFVSESIQTGTLPGMKDLMSFSVSFMFYLIIINFLITKSRKLFKLKGIHWFKMNLSKH